MSLPLGRYFPEIVAALLKLKAERLVIDGELVINFFFGAGIKSRGSAALSKFQISSRSSL